MNHWVQISNNTLQACDHCATAPTLIFVLSHRLCLSSYPSSYDCEVLNWPSNILSSISLFNLFILMWKPCSFSLLRPFPDTNCSFHSSMSSAQDPPKVHRLYYTRSVHSYMVNVSFLVSHPPASQLHLWPGWIHVYPSNTSPRLLQLPQVSLSTALSWF